LDFHPCRLVSYQTVLKVPGKASTILGQLQLVLAVWEDRCLVYGYSIVWCSASIRRIKQVVSCELRVESQWPIVVRIRSHNARVAVALIRLCSSLNHSRTPTRIYQTRQKRTANDNTVILSRSTLHYHVRCDFTRQREGSINKEARIRGFSWLQSSSDDSMEFEFEQLRPNVRLSVKHECIGKREAKGI
jgi:hypothetical protein